MWFDCGNNNYAIAIEGHIFRQKSESKSFYMYFSSFSVFDVDWCT